MTLTIEQRVANGAAFLDVRMPGWADRIDVDTLDLVAPCNCVLGQLFNRYCWGRVALGIDWDGGTVNVGTLGFHAIEDSEEYGPLTDAWTVLVLQRREHRASASSADIALPVTLGPMSPSPAAEGVATQ